HHCRARQSNVLRLGRRRLELIPRQLADPPALTLVAAKQIVGVDIVIHGNAPETPETLGSCVAAARVDQMTAAAKSGLWSSALTSKRWRLPLVVRGTAPGLTSTTSRRGIARPVRTACWLAAANSAQAAGSTSLVSATSTMCSPVESWPANATAMLRW